MKTLLIIIPIVILISCSKTDEIKSIQSKTSSFIKIIPSDDSVTFARRLWPKIDTADSTEHFIMGAAFHLPVKATFDSIRFTMSCYGGYTENCAVRIDSTLVERIEQPIVLSQFGELAFTFKNEIDLDSGWHFIRLHGHANGTVGTNTYYYIEQNNFWVHNEDGQLLVEGLPLIKERYWVENIIPLP